LWLIRLCVPGRPYQNAGTRGFIEVSTPSNTPDCDAHRRIRTPVAAFVELRQNYFFIGVPENANRFPVTLKHCLREEY
jgi:hypothetical protein